MAEYIEREAAQEALKRFCEGMRQNIPRYPNAIILASKDIDEIPAADVVPVVHGRWEFDGSDFADIWKCSACGEDWYFEYDPRDAETRVNYRPSCGAKMDGE